MLTQFYEGETKKFQVNITYNGQAPDITNDTVRLLIKEKKEDTDANAKINKTADVATNGVNGQALFTLTDEETKLTPGIYFYEITWALASGEFYVLESGNVRILDRITDV
ncbi:hypothetical protein Calab_1531 [Caldithrix abyssi DSM 13497]|uniref:Uncharacterized protein n=1 Tax=Caldithrix abyssi DSM 13497 TaxID=880073 RepID=H1XQK5_CALAY|nr:hypothetical protein [Caldithrix abyssi]APF20317.1 hypothetical protein Cabys_3571 [Caldithrix abyssi DSM 13497]EHO40361.1 hypothetical protein Calab_0722 [Caldithrix abyssi DSM 13497]EHO41151.1 hypothetical protein Calab_1531 [Caldithrix abyssi DSM 13497]